MELLYADDLGLMADGGAAFGKDSEIEKEYGEGCKNVGHIF